MCDIATLFNTRTNADLCCFEQIECANYLCGEQSVTVENGNGTNYCYLDQARASENYDKAPSGVCGGNMACALRALSAEPSVSINQELLPTSYSLAEASTTSASTSSQSSGAVPVLNQGMMGLWAVAVLSFAVFGRKLQS
ncbi:hypothetical protein I302_103383 [Kwoniella bestiolae CBS 10118]|uniref:Uncharacterized protein n=1 Tax=Kwoniella bestiolae CBS 10118 TaxID=1296100 RepID=A0A1B9G882_9TREE|nr:hypothetical protein I302_02084 [Kwoniella bestiolae CBS 10118]OCF27244.1 hypothetical protein I302_02084 [Kwoniella bestiolae CBS 10118]